MDNAPPKRGRGRPAGPVNPKVDGELRWLVELWCDAARQGGYRNIRGRKAKNEFGQTWIGFARRVAADVHQRLVVDGDVEGVGASKEALVERMKRLRGEIVAVWRKNK
jgi:hypothetical protein